MPMRIFRNTSLQIDGPTGPNYRRCGRVRCASLRCFFSDFDNLEAEVLDFSASGMRLRLRRSLGVENGAILRVALRWTTDTIELPVKIIWAKRSGFRRHQLGVTFGEASPAMRQQLSQMMHTTADNYIVYDKAIGHVRR